MSNLNPQGYIQKWGGKIGGHLYLRDMGGFEEFLPNADVLSPDQTFNDIKHKNRYLTSSITNWKFISGIPVIVRGSHPNDHEGLVDVIKTVKNVFTPEGIENAINDIKLNASFPLVKSYAEDFEGQPYDGKIRIMIADQLLNKNFLDAVHVDRGSIIEHPHQRNTYLIELIPPNLTPIAAFERAVVRDDEIIHYIDDGDEKTLSDDSATMFKNGDYKQLIDLYQLVQFSEFIPSDTSFQMEFGYTTTPEKGKAKVQFFQAMPFKKFEEPPYFLGDHDKSNYTCFGITPPEGLVLPLRTTSNSIDDEEVDISEPYALIIYKNTRSRSLSFQPKNMFAYLAVGARASSFEHNHYRWIKKAQVSITDNLQTGMEKDTKKIRIISNGINSIVESVD